MLAPRVVLVHRRTELDDVVVVVGQDGLVANVAKYLDGQPVVGINPDREHNPAVLVAYSPTDAGALMRSAVDPNPDVELRAMVEAATDDGQHRSSCTTRP